LALSTLLRLFAPFLPFVTEEVWSWWRSGSVHRASWPTVAETGDDQSANGELFELTAWVLGRIRSAKTEHKRSMRAPVERAVVRVGADKIAQLRLAADDLREAGTIADLVIEAAPDGTEDSVLVELAPNDPPRG
jgi:valyl-tRNA synthetase